MQCKTNNCQNARCVSLLYLKAKMRCTVMFPCFFSTCVKTENVCPFQKVAISISLEPAINMGTVEDLQKQCKSKELRISQVKDDIKCLKLNIKIHELEQYVQDNKIKIQKAERNRNYLLTLADTRQWNKYQRSGWKKCQKPEIKFHTPDIFIALLDILLHWIKCNFYYEFARLRARAKKSPNSWNSWKNGQHQNKGLSYGFMVAPLPKW